MTKEIDKISRNRVYNAEDTVSLEGLRITAEELFGLQNKHFEIKYQDVIIPVKGDRYQTLSFMVNWDETSTEVVIDTESKEPLIVVNLKTIPVKTRIVSKKLSSCTMSLLDAGRYTLNEIEERLRRAFDNKIPFECLYNGNNVDEKKLLSSLNIKCLPKFAVQSLLRYNVSTSDSKVYFGKDGIDKIVIEVNNIEYLVNMKQPNLDHSWVNIVTLREYPKVKTLDEIFK